MLTGVVLLIGLLIAVVIIALEASKNSNNEYNDFVTDHSILLKKIREVNQKYHFKKVESPKLKNKYDNENYFNDISPTDYLTYELVNLKNQVKSSIRDVVYNSNKLDAYNDEIKNIKIFGKYDAEISVKDIDKLNRIERRLANQLIQKPTVRFEIEVELFLTDLNGNILDCKAEKFDVEEIENLLDRLENKTNDFYHDRSIWDSLCRVERGKVTNKLRLDIYKRNHNRCVKCGSMMNLEIDHIKPISKGGKSTIDNLQTLCHSCNVKKSNLIESNFSKSKIK